jgi:hypothetical protein
LSCTPQPFLALVIFQVGLKLFAQGQTWTMILLPMPPAQMELQAHTATPSLLVEMGS